jgi:hypothetical protein
MVVRHLTQAPLQQCISKGSPPQNIHRDLFIKATSFQILSLSGSDTKCYIISNSISWSQWQLLQRKIELQTAAESLCTTGSLLTLIGNVLRWVIQLIVPPFLLKGVHLIHAMRVEYSI